MSALPYPSIDWNSDDRVAVARAHIEALFHGEVARLEQNAAETTVFDREKRLADTLSKVLHVLQAPLEVLEKGRKTTLAQLAAAGIVIEPLADGKLDGALWRRMGAREHTETPRHDFTSRFFEQACAKPFNRVIEQAAPHVRTWSYWLTMAAPVLSDGAFDGIKISALADHFAEEVARVLTGAHLHQIVRLTLSVPSLRHADYPDQLFRSRFYMLDVVVPFQP